MKKVISVILIGLVFYSFCYAQQKTFGYKISGGSDIISDAILIQDGFVLDSAVVNFNIGYDSAKYQFEYFGDGKLKSDISSKGLYVREFVNNRYRYKWLPGRNHYFYDEHGKIDSVKYFIWRDTIWVNGYIIHYSYDNDDNLLSKVYSDSEKIFRTEINKYDSSGNLILSEQQVIAWLNDTTNTTKEYDSKYRLTKVITRTGQYGHYYYYENLYQYDSSGNINCSNLTRFDGIQDTVYKYPYYYFKFDNSGKLQKECWNLYRNVGLDSTKGEILSFYYDNNNKIQKIYYGDQLFHYDADGNLDTLRIIHTSNGYLANRAALMDSYGNRISFSDYSGYNIFYYSKLVTGVEKSKDIEKTFTLSQNYPNPFNPTTTISFNLPSRSLVSLTIFDILGRKVATIINGEILSAGNYSKQWNASDISSGVYFYQLKAGAFTETKKLILLR